MQLINLKGDTYLLESRNKVGIYVFNKNEVAVIDTGIDEKSGQAIMQICADNNWEIKMILNTHGHADHIGGNAVIEKTLKVPIYAYQTEKVMIQNPHLISATAYGGFPHQYLKSPYLMAEASEALELSADILPEGLEFFPLPGHNSDMVGFKTKDEVCFLADAVAGEDILTKHPFQFMFDFKAYFETLEMLSELNGAIFVPSHGENTTDIKSLVTLNKETALGIIQKIKELCEGGINFDHLLKELATFYHLKLEFIQHCLIGTTLRCYLSYLLNEGIIKADFIDNELLWTTV